MGEWTYSFMDGGEWSSSRPGHFIFGEKGPGTPWIGGCVGLIADLEAVT